MITATDGVYTDSPRPTLWRRFGRLLVFAPLLLLLLGTHMRPDKPIVRGFGIAAKVTRMSDELSALQAENDQLRRAVAALETEEGKECAARRALGVVAPGERLIVLAQEPPADAGPHSLAERTQACIARSRLAATRGLRRTGRVCSLWLGLQDADSFIADNSPQPAAADSLPQTSSAQTPTPTAGGGALASEPPTQPSADKPLDSSQPPLTGQD